MIPLFFILNIKNIKNIKNKIHLVPANIIFPMQHSTGPRMSLALVCCWLLLFVLPHTVCAQAIDGQWLNAYQEALLREQSNRAGSLSMAMLTKKGITDSVKAEIFILRSSIGSIEKNAGKIWACLDSAARYANGKPYLNCKLVLNRAQAEMHTKWAPNDALRELSTVKEKDWRTVFAHDPESQYAYHNLLAYIFFAQSKDEDAVSELEKAEKYLRKSPSATYLSPDFNNIKGLVYLGMGQYDVAIESFKKNLLILQQKGAQHIVRNMNTHNNLAQTYINAMSYYEAEQQLDSVLLLAQRYHQGDYPYEYLLHRGWLYTATGEYQQAEHYLQEAKHFLLQKQGRSYDYHLAVLSLVILYNKSERTDSARVYLVEAQSLLQELMPDKENGMYAELYMEWGIFYEQLGDYQNALSYYQKYLALNGRLYKQKSVYEANAHAMLAVLFAKMGNCAKASARARNALELFRATNTSRTPKAFEMELLLANCSERPAEKLRALNECLHHTESYRAQNPIIFLPTVSVLNALAQLSNEQDTEAGRYEAARYLDRAIELLITGQGQINDGQYSRKLSGLLDATFHFALTLAQQLYEAAPNKHNAEHFFSIMEKSKAANMRFALNDYHARQFAGVPNALTQKELALRQQLTFCDAQLSNPRIAPKLRSEYLSQVTKARDALQNIRLELDRYPHYQKLKFSNNTASIEETREKLLKRTPESAFVSYVTIKDDLFAVYIDKEGQHIQTAKNTPLPTLVAQWRQAMRQDEASSYQSPAHELYLVLLGKLLPNGKPPERLFVAPEGILSEIDFEALVVSNAARPKSFKDLDYLLRHSRVSCIQSATIFLQSKTKARPSKKSSLLAFGPGFTAPKPTPDSIYATLAAQPFSLQLLQALARWPHAKTFENQLATETNFKRFANGNALIHLSTHGILDAHHPLRSFLVFAQQQSPDDGLLYGHEILSTSLDADLAVLMACETGRGSFARTNGVQSLANSFSFAGCPRTIFSLWEIDEQYAAETLGGFYEKLKYGATVGEALHAAKLATLDKAGIRAANPFYWGGLVLQGEPDWQYRRESPYWFWLLAAGIALAIYLAIRYIMDWKK
jgi:CHAT domain-containing protein